MRFRPLAALAMITMLGACGGGTSEPQPDNVVATVTVTALVTTMAPGATAQFSATAKNAAGTTLSAGSPTWTSSNQGVATVSTGGLVTAVANGTATITATIGGIQGTRGVTVATITPSPSATVDAGSGNVFSPAQVDITRGGTVTWHFTGANEHNVTFASAASGTPANIGNTLNADVTRTFTTAGSFPYNCSLHAGMTGTVIVH
ncbi:MAG TPA: Ig-like domain-containing protein [Gemmatimonadaceae bacterium]|nr:Ig-like domain-containing protein [Gemmatimonadaceae bacterium]